MWADWFRVPPWAPVSAGAPVAARRANERLDLFATGSDGAETTLGPAGTTHDDHDSSGGPHSRR
jgi:hypothetical protein